MTKKFKYKRIVTKSGRSDVIRHGFPPSFFSDQFHSLLRRRWPSVFALLILFVFLSNLFFSGIYLALGPTAIQNAEPGSFWDTFFFSVQTMATVGYGKLTPATLPANIVASIEAMYGLLSFAIVAGLIFAKFSKPTAKIIFSDMAVVNRRNEKNVLSFRMVNERNNQIINISLNAVLMRTELTTEGDIFRTFYELFFLE
jgi:inward rectifier potassium channel